MLAEEVGAGIGPGVGLGGGGGSAVAERRRARGVSRPSPEGRYPSPNIVDDVEVGSVTTTTRLPIGDGEGDGDRVGGGASREGAGGGSTDRGSGSDGGSDASDDAATDDAKMCPGVSRGNADAPVEGTRGVVVRAARLDDSGSRPATPALPEASAARGDASGVPGSAPPAAAEAAERMMRALGLDARMSSDKLAATARRYANLMAASREGHVMAARDAAAGEGVSGMDAPASSGMDAPASGDKRKRRAEDRPDAKDATDGSFEMVVERDLELATLCEHHLLPFHGAVHVAYLRPASGVGSGARGAAARRHQARSAVSGAGAPDARHRARRSRRVRSAGRDGRRARVAPVHDRAGGGKTGVHHVHVRVSRRLRGERARRGAFWSALASEKGGEEGRR